MKITNILNWKTLSKLEKCIKTNEWIKSMCKAELQKNETDNLEVHYQNSKQRRFE